MRPSSTFRNYTSSNSTLPALYLGQVLAGQLLGRLETVGEEGGRLLHGASERTRLRPRQVRMSRAGGPLIRTLEGHTSWVNAVAVLDARRVVSASSDGTLRVWDVESGETLGTLEGHTSEVAGDSRGGVHFLDLDL